MKRIEISDEVAAYARLYGTLVFQVPHYRNEESSYFDQSGRLRFYSVDIKVLEDNPEAVRKFHQEGL